MLVFTALLTLGIACKNPIDSDCVSSKLLDAKVHALIGYRDQRGADILEVASIGPMGVDRKRLNMPGYSLISCSSASQLIAIAVNGARVASRLVVIGSMGKKVFDTPIDGVLESLVWAPDGKRIAVSCRKGEEEKVIVLSKAGVKEKALRLDGSTVFGGWVSNDHLALLDVSLSSLRVVAVGSSIKASGFRLAHGMSAMGFKPSPNGDKIIMIGEGADSRPLVILASNQGKTYLGLSHHRMVPSETFWTSDGAHVIAHCYAFLSSPDVPDEAVRPTGHWIARYSGRDLSQREVLAKATVEMGDLPPLSLLGLQRGANRAFVWVKRQWNGRKAGIWSVDATTSQWSLILPTDSQTRFVQLLGS